VVNAREACGGYGTITIETSSAELDENFCQSHPGAKPGFYTQFSVSDNGSGMDDHTKAHIFEPFFTTREVGMGTGLGMSTVYGIVKQNRGYITVESQLGQGTRIQIYLPRHQGEWSQTGTERQDSAAGAQPT
jgi:signal transduction histidine kinase